MTQNVTTLSWVRFNRYSLIVFLYGLFEAALAVQNLITSEALSFPTALHLTGAVLVVVSSMLTRRMARRGRPVHATTTLNIVIILIGTALGIIIPKTVINIALIVAIGLLTLINIQPNWRLLILIVFIYQIGLILISGLPGNFGLPQWALSQIWEDSSLVIWIGRGIILTLIVALTLRTINNRRIRNESLPLGYLMSIGGLLLVAGAILVIIGLFSTRLQNELSERTGQQFQIDAEVEGDHQLGYLQAEISELELFAQLPQITEGVETYMAWIRESDSQTDEILYRTTQTPRLERMFGDFEAEHELFSDMILTDDQGNEILTTIERSASELSGGNYEFTEWWSTPFEQGDIYYGLSDTTNTTDPIFYIAVPVLRGGSTEIVGVIRATVTPRKIPFLDVIASPDKEIEVIDTRGVGGAFRGMILNNSTDLQEIGTIIEDVVVESFQRQPTNWEIIEHHDNEIHIHGYATVSLSNNDENTTGLRWVVLVEQPLEYAIAPVTASVRLALTVALIVLAITTITSALFTEIILRPINRFIGVATEMAAGNINLKAPATGSEEFQQLSQAFNRITQQLSDQVALLQVRVQDRTRYLVASQEVARTANALLDPDELIDRIVNLIADRFGFYQVGIYLVDNEEKTATLKAATGSIGRTLVQNQHQYQFDSDNLITQAITTRKRQFSTTTHAPLLEAYAAAKPPEERAQMALPLLVGNNVLGVLDVQATANTTFDFEDQNTVAVLQTTADQIATALNNAQSFTRQNQLAEENRRLLKETEENINKLQRLTQQLSAEGWESFFKRRETEITVEDIDDIEFTEEWITTAQAHSIEQAIRSQDMVQANGETPELAVPIKIRDMVIGAIALTDEGLDQEETWNEDDVAIVSEVAEHIALAVENARLLDETHVRLAEQNWLYQVARAASSAANLHDALKVSAEMIHQRMISAIISILLVDEERHTLRQSALVGYTQEISNFEIPLDQSVYRKIVKTGQPILISDTHESGLNLEEHTLVSGSLLIIPLTLGDEVLGIIQCESEEIDLFTENDQSLLTTLASTLAAVIVSNQLFETEKRQRQLATTLKDVAQKMSEALIGETELRMMMLQEIFEYMQPDEIKLYEWIAIDDTLRIAQSIPELDTPYDSESRLITADQRADLWDVFTTEEPILDLISEDNNRIREHYLFPWRVGEVTTGIIELQHTSSPGGLTVGTIEQQLCDGIIRQAANAIQLARLYEEQRQTAERLAELDRLKSQFLANMSHELRTPLNSIIGFSRVILKGIDGPITPLQEQDLTAIYKAGQHLLQLINDVLDLSKIEAGKMELAFEDVDLIEMIDDVLNSTIRALVKDKPVELRQNAEPGLPLVHADRIRLRQVLINVAGNASKFTDEGYIEIATRRIIESERRMIEVAVNDTGPGISDEGMQKLFKSFSQVDSSPTRASGGSGLGLALCKYIIEMHGGRIWVESEVGTGSSFKFTIPITQGEDDDGKEWREEEYPPASQDLILAIDNDPGLFEVYERYLRDTNYELIGKIGSDITFDEIIERQPAAILLDPELENADGWALLEQLTTHEQTGNIPVIIISVNPDETRAKNTGAHTCLTKPILEPDLLHALAFEPKQETPPTKPVGTGTLKPLAPDVLLIDDRPEDLRLIKETLNENAELRIREAVGGLAGIMAIQSNPPQAIILDLMMPEINGYNIIEAVKSDPKTRNIPILVVTGAELSPDDHARLERYGTAYWLKDIFRDEDNQKVVNMLETLEQMFNE